MKKKILEVFFDEKENEVTIIETAAFGKLDSSSRTDIRTGFLEWTNKTKVNDAVRKLAEGKK